MRIPTSLVVMSCVTALPFGLAIRDTVRHTPRGEELDLTGSRVREREAKLQAEREEAKARAEHEARLRERDAQIDAIYGKTVASRGTLTESAPGIELSYDDDDVELVTVSAAICDRLHDRLVATWGTGTDNIWLDPSTHQRAWFSTDSCSIVFDHYLEPDAWVAALPLDAVGAPKQTLTTELDGAATEQLGQLEWRAPGVGFGHDYARLSAEIGSGKIVGINAISDTDYETQMKIRDALSSRLNVEASHDVNDPNVWTWKSKPPVRLDSSGAHRFSVQIGRLSWQ